MSEIKDVGYNWMAK